MTALDLDAVRLRVERIASGLRDGNGPHLSHVRLALSRLDALADDLGKGLLDRDPGASDVVTGGQAEPQPEAQPESLGQMIKREAAEHRGDAA